MMGKEVYFFSFILSLIAGLMITPRMGKLAVKLGVVDRPAHRKTHAKIIPYLGGAAVFSAMILTLLVVGLYGLIQGWLTPVMAIKGGVILFSTLGIMAVGLFDDVTQISPIKKLTGQIFFASLFVLFGFRLEVFGFPGLFTLDLPLFITIPLTIFWILAMINAVNMVDGSDGLAG
ncbi:MAG TPA: undecaprenyl/decaprenyl-phosphate alpha-N-acetylglucosaminyl 1-phosphate transferase, partial [bacterium]|nr:undecaprenyl/decaprenyl-phosphate alpha-N-acetylglucosaminyl 1-phosphate transferase [bacterium]